MLLDKSNEKALTRLQQRLFDLMHSKAHASYLAHHSRSLKNYEKKFLEDLPTKFRESSWAELLEALSKHKFVLFADFHTLEASQRVFLKALSATQLTHPVLALEAFRSQDQRHLDLFLQDKIHESEFLKKIQYQKTWGFPWGVYREILQLAKKARISVYGINHPGRSPHERDRKIARELLWIQDRHPNQQILTLIGELHLGKGHLPSLLPKPLVVLNNIESLVFRASFVKILHSSRVFKLDGSTFCVFNASPWKKWFSYLLWENDLDLDSQFLSLTKFLSEALNLPPETDLENFNLLLAEHFYEKSHKLNQLTQFFGHFVHNNQVILKEFSVDHLLRSSGEFLYLQITPLEMSPNKSLETFFNHQLVKTTFGCFSLNLFDPLASEPIVVEGALDHKKTKDLELIVLCKNLGQNWGEALFAQTFSRNRLSLAQVPKIFFSAEKTPEDAAHKIQKIALHLLNS